MAKQSAASTSAIKDRFHESLGLVMLFLSVYVTISLFSYSNADPSYNVASPAVQVIFNKGGLFGAYISDALLQYFSLAAFIVPFVLALYGIRVLKHSPRQDTYVLLTVTPLILLSVSVLMQMWSPTPDWPIQGGIGNGGLVGKLAVSVMLPMLGIFGTITLSSIITVLGIMWWSGLTLYEIYANVINAYKMMVHCCVCVIRSIARIKFRKALQIDLPLPNPMPKFKEKTQARVERVIPEVVKPTASAPENNSARQEILPLNMEGEFNLPNVSILTDTPQQADGESEEALQKNARQIEAQLANFGIKGTVSKICPGPVITIYELEPAAGVKTATIVGLSNDLARAMSAMAIRIAPIPGKNVIGIEMPNRKRKMVTLREMLATEAFETHPGKLTVALGVDTSGHPVYADIAKMPHALIAGTTGSGKSVAMNAFILSLAYRMSPDKLRFLMVDPKMLELSIYNDIPHLLSPVITDPHKAAGALKWAVKEMENRYRLMTVMGVKNMQSFNAKFEELKAKDAIPTHMVAVGFNPQTGQPIHEERKICDAPLPYIVIVLDELADLMMVAGKEVEQSIARLAQMARASGMHLLIATQRPSVDVITGLIKANVPTRISFNVTSKIDSRTILDSMGAEQLLGKGDMLYMENGSNNLQRLHGAFVDEDECHAVANHLKEQGKVEYVDIFKSPQANAGGAGVSGGASAGAASAGGEDSEGEDPLYNQAIEIVAREQKASTSFIQRHLKIGYNRAAGIIERLEADGMVSAANHVGKREVILKQPPQDGY